MAKTPEKFPVTLYRGEDEREVHQVASFNQAVWDGFVTADERDAAEEAAKAAEPSPQQKAAETRRKNREAAEGTGEKPQTESTVGTVASGGTAAGETTVGSNPS